MDSQLDRSEVYSSLLRCAYLVSSAAREPSLPMETSSELNDDSQKLRAGLQRFSRRGLVAVQCGQGAERKTGEGLCLLLRHLLSRPICSLVGQMHGSCVPLSPGCAVS